MSQPGGVGRVAEHLVRGLSDIDDPGYEVLLWGSPERLGEIPAWCRVAATDRVGKEWRGQRQWFETPRHDGALYLHQVRPLRDWSSATMVHDTIQLHQGSAARRRAKRVFLRSVVRRSRRVVTVSEHSRGAIIAELGCPPDRIEVVRLPLDRDLARRVRARRAELRSCAATAIGSDVLWVGRVEPNKNLEGLFAAFAASGLDGRVRLHVFGATPAQRETLLALGRRLGIAHLEVATATSDADLVDAYARAALVVVPSFEEGWGLPAYEALACGIPVLASSGGALPEQARFARGSFRLVDVRRPGELARALAESPLDVDHAAMDADSLTAVASGPTRADLATHLLHVVSDTRHSSGV